MATDAKAYADKMGGTMQHSDSYGLAPPLGPSGENLALGHSTVESATSDWYNEVVDCKTLPGCESPKSSGQQVGHFTALIWKGAKSLGCGSSSQNLHVCRYKGDDAKNCNTPNMGGCYTANVNAATKTEAQCHRRRGA